MLREREATDALFCQGGIEICVQAPVLDPGKEGEYRFAIQAAVETCLQLLGIEAFGETFESICHRIEERVLVCEQVLAGFANRIAGTEVFSVAADDQLLDQVRSILREFQRVIATRKNRRLVELEIDLELGSTGKQLLYAGDEFSQYFAHIAHRFSQIDRRVKVGARDLQAIEERVEQVLAGNVHLRRLAGLRWFLFLARGFRYFLTGFFDFRLDRR